MLFFRLLTSRLGVSFAVGDKNVALISSKNAKYLRMKQIAQEEKKSELHSESDRNEEEQQVFLNLKGK